jgi:rRNA-processing protein FCF1
MKILLDTNFILTCAKRKIDFEEQTQGLVDEGIEWIVPQEVLNELGNLKDKEGMKGKDKEAAELAFEIVKKVNHCFVENISKRDKGNVDIMIVNYLIKHDDIILATMDKNLKQRLPHRKFLTVRGDKNLEIV